MFGLRGVGDGIADDVSDVMVGQGVDDLLAVTFGRQQTGAAQHSQVLGDQRLIEPEALDDLMDPMGPARQEVDDGHAMGIGQRLQQVGGGGEA